MGSTSSEEHDDLDKDGLELDSFLNHRRSSLKSNSRMTAFTKAMAVVNFVLGIALVMSLAFVAKLETPSPSESCLETEQIKEPYSPALEAIVPITKKFKPELIYQSETSPQVEAAWKKILGVNEGMVAIGPEESTKLAETNHESTESIWEPGKHVYGISMYHQLHCLNTIRKSFYREKFYPGIPDDRFYFHKNHCFDFLRQAIMCHGDVSMTYWWNKDYTSRQSDGREVHSDWFNNLSLDDRATNSSVFWNIEHSCRMFEPIEAWVEKHPLLPPGVSFSEDTLNAIEAGTFEHNKAHHGQHGGH